MDYDIELNFCKTCGANFPYEKSFLNARRKDRKAFHCPNGHGWVFTGKTKEEMEIEKLMKQITLLEHEKLEIIKDLKSNRLVWKRQYDLMAHKANAYKGLYQKAKRGKK